MKHGGGAMTGPTDTLGDRMQQLRDAGWDEQLSPWSIRQTGIWGR
jgi:hypothetical protein